MKVTNPGDQPVHEIRRFHELGRRVIDRAAKDRSDVTAAAIAVGADERTSVDRARKAARFASGFGNRSVGRLCALHFPDGTPLSVNHVRRVLKVKYPGEWRTWLERAATAGWSADRLDREIKQSIEPGSATGGPKIKAPADLSDVLGQVSEWTGAWLKRDDAIWSQDGSWPPKTGLGNADPTRLRARLREVRRGLEKLRQRAEALEGRIKAIEMKVSRERGTKSEKGVNGKGVGKAKS